MLGDKKLVALQVRMQQVCLSFRPRNLQDLLGFRGQLQNTYHKHLACASEKSIKQAPHLPMRFAMT